MNNYTKEYIEQVINNPDIQSLCKHNKGDWFWNGEKPVVYCKAGLGSFNPYEHKWLPTLEDYFKILGKNLSDTLFCIGHDKTNIDEIYETTLKWVMYIVYNKEWNFNSKEWEAINGNN